MKNILKRLQFACQILGRFLTLNGVIYLVLVVNRFYTMGGCLKACCATEAGLRCHSVITLCGFGYFTLMFLVFPRQELYFEFEVTDPQGTRWACLFTALLFLLFFFIAMINLSKVDQNKKSGTIKQKISLASFREAKNSLRQDDKEMARLIEE